MAYLNNRVYTEWYAACILWLAESTGSFMWGVAQIDQSISMVPGRPSVLFRRQLVHILWQSQRTVLCDVDACGTYCGMICIHQQLQSDLC